MTPPPDNPDTLLGVVPQPDPALADLTDAEQVELIEPTGNGPEAGVPQPGPDYVPEPS